MQGRTSRKGAKLLSKSELIRGHKFSKISHCLVIGDSSGHRGSGWLRDSPISIWIDIDNDIGTKHNCVFRLSFSGWCNFCANHL